MKIYKLKENATQQEKIFAAIHNRLEDLKWIITSERDWQKIAEQEGTYFIETFSYPDKDGIRVHGERKL